MLKTFTNLPILTFSLGSMRNRWATHPERVRDIEVNSFAGSFFWANILAY
jgi:hypothetical protein